MKRGLTPKQAERPRHDTAEAAVARRHVCGCPRVFAIAALLAMFAGFAWFWHAGPVPPAWYPPCPLHELTGILCPGCGSARVLHDLAHGQILSACGHNILIVCLVPFLAIWTVVSLWRGLRHNLAPLQPPLGAARLVLVVVMVFWVTRNLPWWPFTLLAPAA